MQNHSVSASNPAWNVSANKPVAEPASKAASSVMAPTDEVEISSLGRMLDDASRTNGLREQRLAQIKSAIEAGTYETPDKLEAAVGRLLNSLQLDEVG
jgi:anti-sigma28 factor (negative regulator of flagellin synthesis)